MGSMVRQQAGASLPADQAAGPGLDSPTDGAGSPRQQAGIQPGDQVHVRMADAGGTHCWSRFPWTVTEVRAARDGGDVRYVVTPPSGNATHVIDGTGLKPWEGFGA